MRVIVQFPHKLHTIDEELFQKVAFIWIFFIINCELLAFIISATVVYKYY